MRSRLLYIGCGMFIQTALLAAVVGNAAFIPLGLLAVLYYWLAGRFEQLEKKHG